MYGSDKSAAAIVRARVVCIYICRASFYHARDIFMALACTRSREITLGGVAASARSYTFFEKEVAIYKCTQTLCLALFFLDDTFRAARDDEE